jgi:acetyl-CoA carboxylase biotin carboxylase subunit
MLGKVLVANRGEIAVRLIRGLREMNIASAAVYSEADRAAYHVRLADEAYPLGPAPATESYLSIERIVNAARRANADAVHPGYGFLSENPDFAAACEDAGIVFIGPSEKAMRRLGSKIEARKLAKQAGVAVVEGMDAPLSGIEEARAEARRIGYPVLLKAAAGGGGKGMRRVEEEAELEAALRDASSEAERAFASGAVYLEKFVEQPRHIEIQVFGDHHGNLIHLGERECSLQRRHQKVIEECPSPLMSVRPELRERMGQAALKVARAAGYTNAGTAEFLVDKHGNFYFLEMNTRLQVEHPVTELVTGLDLVHWQLRVASGEVLGLEQADVSWRGSAMECRIYAEDPDNHFLPSPGRIVQLHEPAGPGIRLDSGVYEGWRVPIEYDPLLAKLVAWGPAREVAIARLDRALGEYAVVGIRTTIPYFREILRDELFRAGHLDTGFLAAFEPRRRPRKDERIERLAAIAAIAHEQRELARNQTPDQRETSCWAVLGRAEALR